MSNVSTIPANTILSSQILSRRACRRAKLLGAWASPLPQIRFCPTGGIAPSTAKVFLSLPNVLCLGGSWLTPADKLKAGDWAAIEQLAREVAALRG